MGMRQELRVNQYRNRGPGLSWNGTPGSWAGLGWGFWLRLGQGHENLRVSTGLQHQVVNCSSHPLLLFKHPLRDEVQLAPFVPYRSQCPSVPDTCLSLPYSNPGFTPSRSTLSAPTTSSRLLLCSNALQFSMTPNLDKSLSSYPSGSRSDDSSC